MEEAVPIKRIQEKKCPLDHKEEDLNQRIMEDFLDLVDLVMDFSFRLASVPSRLLSSQRHLVDKDRQQLLLDHRKQKMNSFSLSYFFG